ncbi:AfsR/SARP family transcriptional regulator [Deinococcus budaensis]|uniref:AfsR/SARP family transcriptional regulator n=1 Tax=Deinococcus budaensis TaxID=1665626 RepID=UPI0035F4936C
MPMLEVWLFGVFQARLHAANAAPRPLALDSQRTRELLGFLLLHPGEPQAREVLASALWGGQTTAQSLKGLRQALWQLQLALPPELRGGEGLLHLHPDSVELRPGAGREAGLRCDALTFQEVAGSLRGRAGHGLTPAEALALPDAAALDRGDLLEGWMADWCLAQRERLHTLYLAALEKLTDHCEVCREWESGLAYAARILAYDRASEDTHRQVMRLHYLSGHRTAALRQFGVCEQALREELGVRPSRATLALWECIREDRPLEDPSLPADGAAAAAVRPPPPQPGPDLLQELRSVLLEVRALLAEGR